MKQIPSQKLLDDMKKRYFDEILSCAYAIDNAKTFEDMKYIGNRLLSASVTLRHKKNFFEYVIEK